MANGGGNIVHGEMGELMDELEFIVGNKKSVLMINMFASVAKVILGSVCWLWHSGTLIANVGIWQFCPVGESYIEGVG